MKRKIIAFSVFAASTLAVLAGYSSNPSSESTRDPFGVNERTIKNLQVGEEAEVKHSTTAVQIGSDGTKSYLRFATAISGPIKSATYTRTRSDDASDVKVKEVEYVYEGIKAGDEILYYTAEGTTSTKPETTSYYWACYTLSFSTDEYKDVDFSVTLNLVGEDETIYQVETRTSSYDDLITRYEATLTNASFTSGQSVNLKPGEKLPEITFDGDLEEAYVVDSDGNAAFIDQYVMPSNDVSLTVYEAVDYVTSGYGKLKVGYCNGANGLTTNSAYSAYSASLSWGDITLIGDATEGYDVAKVLNLNNVQYKETISEGTGTNANFRLMTAYNRKTNVAYYYKFTFKNLGTTELDFDLYKRNSGSDTTEVTQRQHVVIAPGATEKVYFEWTNGVNNNNDLTYFKFNKDVSNGAMAITYYIDNPENYKTYTATLKEATFANDSSSVTLKAGESLPEVNYSESTENKTLGWIVVDNQGNRKYQTAADFVMPSYDVTLIPYNTIDHVDTASATADGHINTWSGSGVNTNNIDPSPNSSPNISTSLSRTPVVEGEKVGANISVDAEAEEFFRFRHELYVSSNDTNTIYYTLKNNGDATAKFTLYQVNSGIDITGVPSVYVELAPGETKNVSLTFNFGNRNIMSFFKFAEAYSGTIWMAQDFNIRYDSTLYSATITGGAKFADGSATASLKANSSLPAVTYDDASITSDVYNLGWIVTDEEGNKSFAYTEDFVMPYGNVTLTPYNTVKFILSKENTAAGVLDTWSKNILHRTFDEEGKEKGHYASNEFPSVNISNMSISLSGEAVFEGDKPGGLLNINAQANGFCRSFHAYWSSSKLVNKYVTYTFKNYSETETASFTFAQMSKGGTDITGMPQQDVVLAPGESITFTLENGLRGNGNLIWVMKYNQAFNGSLYYAARVDATNPNA